MQLLSIYTLSMKRYCKEGFITYIASYNLVKLSPQQFAVTGEKFNFSYYAFHEHDLIICQER
jgi:hypothetical protein